jgi:hypothetical protein
LKCWMLGDRRYITVAASSAAFRLTVAVGEHLVLLTRHHAKTGDGLLGRGVRLCQVLIVLAESLAGITKKQNRLKLIRLDDWRRLQKTPGSATGELVSERAVVGVPGPSRIYWK